jgi:hypothetical protein
LKYFLNIKKILQIISLAIAIFLSFSKVVTVLSITPMVDPYDSPSYFDFKFVGGVRMPGISFIFSSLESYENIVLFQSIIACVCWTLFSQIIFKLKYNQYILFTTSMLILGVGFSNQVVYVDGFINAESLNISFIILFIASCILFFVRQTLFSVLLCSISLGLYASVKSINGISIIIPLIFFAIFLIKKNGFKNNLSNLLAICILFLSVVSTYLFRNIDASPILNTSALINQRLWQIDYWKEYTLNQGFPIEGRNTYVRFASRNLGLPPDTAVSQDPEYKEWYYNGGDKFIVKFMLTHPEYVIVAPLALSLFSENFDLSTSIWGGGAKGILNYEGINQDLAKKWPGNPIFWNPDRSTSYVGFSGFLALIGFTLIYSRKLSLKQKEFQLFISLLMLFAIEISYLAWWFGSTPADIGRHQFPFGVLIRVIFILSFMHVLQIILDVIKVRTNPLN